MLGDKGVCTLEQVGNCSSECILCRALCKTQRFSGVRLARISKGHEVRPSSSLSIHLVIKISTGRGRKLYCNFINTDQLRTAPQRIQGLPWTYWTRKTAKTNRSFPGRAEPRACRWQANFSFEMGLSKPNSKYQGSGFVAVGAYVLYSSVCPPRATRTAPSCPRAERRLHSRLMPQVRSAIALDLQR